MNSRTPLFVGLAAVATLLSGPGHAQVVSPESAEQLFNTRCATCHTDQPVGFAPTRELISSRTPEVIVSTLTSGSMRQMATGLSTEEIHAIAGYLTGVEPTRLAQAGGTQNLCTDRPTRVDPAASGWNGWGIDVHNTRFQKQGGLRAEDVPRLQVKWTFAYPEGLVYTQPTVIGDRVFVGSMPGLVHSLDLETGCTHWTYDPGPGARAAITVSSLQTAVGVRPVAYVADGNSVVHALDAETGELIWKTRVEDHPISRITGSPVLHEGRLYVTISSDEERAATNEDYECCTFRGSVVALDARDGSIAWKSYVIEDEPQPFRTNRLGRAMYGPAGAAIWMSPTLDLQRGSLYVGTGNAYTEVPETSSSGLLSLDMGTGRIRWTHQITDGDAFVVGCGGNGGHANCPDDVGPDFDFGASPILRTLSDGRELLLVGQKSGILFAVDPDDGSIVWKKRLGGGSPLGGIQWGMAADAEHVYVAVSDVLAFGPDRRPGVSKIRVDTGEEVWHAPAPPPSCSWSGGRGCSNGQSAAVTLIPDLLFSGALDGNLRAYSSHDGSILWSFDTAGETYQTVNGFTVRGGSLDSGGATVANGHVLVNSGYTRYGVGHPGNLLLVLSVDGN